MQTSLRIVQTIGTYDSAVHGCGLRVIRACCDGTLEHAAFLEQTDYCTEFVAQPLRSDIANTNVLLTTSAAPP